MSRRFRFSLRTLFIAAVIAVVLIIIVAGGHAVYVGISTSLRAEENLHATLFVVRLVERFVSERKRWPSSWEDLDALACPSDPPEPGNGQLSVVRIGGQRGFDWPAASSELQKHVFVDFAANPETIAAQDPRAFSAIKPIGPYFEYHGYGFVQSLQQTIRDVADDHAPVRRPN